MKKLVEKYLEGNISKNEQAELLGWLRKNNSKSVFIKYKSDWKNHLDLNWFPSEGENSWNQIQTAIFQNSYKGWRKSNTVQIFFKYAAIFFFITTLGGLIWFFTGTTFSQHNFHTNVIAENGHISKVELPDGSLVWLNSGSKITYNNKFASKNRNIELSGEAYFKIVENEKLPLIVTCEELQVKVLGTCFNVSAFPENSCINVVLEKGAVELLNTKVESFNYRLKPGELAQFDKENLNLNVSEINTTKFTSWKDGIINIYNQPLDEVVKRLEIRYNQQFDFEEHIKDFHYTFTIKNESLSEIIQLMEKITPVKAIQKDEVIIFQLEKNSTKKTGA